MCRDSDPKSFPASRTSRQDLLSVSSFTDMPCSRWLVETTTEQEMGVGRKREYRVVFTSCSREQMQSTSQPSSRLDPTDQRRLRSSSGERPPPPNTRRGAAAAATIGGGDSGDKRWAAMNCGSVVAPTAHTRPRPAPRPVTTTMQDSRWLVDDDGRQVGLCVRDDGGDAGAKWGERAMDRRE